ncbi:hypothetical protein [Rhizobium phaseoli]|uniref:hypothetical protein n=1 Tax=Rhizobium phaseoli TaxID=396 RepID=UPI000BBA9FA7|nr:hypothetical protein [Rhizobium phaseoli]PCD66802.1 hypothetical protein CO648_15185 [Rhizobium phaseoli]
MNKPILIPVEKRTVFTSAGKGDLAYISAEIAEKAGVSEGTVKLLNGIEGTKGGFGREHIEARRMAQISGLGFKDVVSYVYHVVCDFDRIAIQEDGRLMILREHNGLHHIVIVQWDDQLNIWSVTTALPKKVVRDIKIIWEK